MFRLHAVLNVCVINEQNWRDYVFGSSVCLSVRDNVCEHDVF